MDRATVYTQEQGRSVDFLFAQRAAMIGLAKLSSTCLGANTVVRGLSVTPNSPAALNVLVGIGEIYSVEEVDATAWGALPADTTDMILKQGLNMASQTISTPAPITGGYSINYLIEAQYQDQDTNPAVLPYYNSANPQQPLNGQGGGGAAQATQRQGVCAIQAKAGIAAPTGTQVTPSADSGWTGIAVVTVAYGQTTVTSGNISIPAGVPLITNLLQMMQTGSATYAVDSSTTANTITLALTPPITAYTDGEPITFKAANNNTGPCTINAGPGSINLVGAAGAFQGGEIIAGSQYTALYSASLGEAVLCSQTGGAEQINPGTKSQHAVQFGQVSGVVGSVRNLVMNVTAASASATMTADEIIVETALGGLRFCLPSFSQTINLATTGAGGMDTGSAPTSGYVALYAIYNPTTATAALLATNATSAAAPSVYAGGHMPSGYTASGLVSVWPTNSSGQLIVGTQRDRHVYTGQNLVLNTTSVVSTMTSLNIASAVPKNAISCDWHVNVAASASQNIFINIQPDLYGYAPTGAGVTSTNIGLVGRLAMTVAQTLYYVTGTSTGPTWSLYITGYEF